jgi:hypothetical protein
VTILSPAWRGKRASEVGSTPRGLAGAARCSSPAQGGPHVPGSLNRVAGAKRGSALSDRFRSRSRNREWFRPALTLPREFEPRGELRGDFHPSGELEPDRPLVGVVDGVHHVDRQTALVEDVRDSDVLDLEGRSLERPRGDDDVAFLLEDPVHPVDRRLGAARRLHREDVVVLVLGVAGLVRPQTSERARDRRGLQADGRDIVEIHRVGHDALSCHLAWMLSVYRPGPKPRP